MPGAGARRRGGAGASSVLPARASRRSPREVPPSALRSVCTTRTAALFETRRIYFRYTDCLCLLVTRAHTNSCSEKSVAITASAVSVCRIGVVQPSCVRMFTVCSWGSRRGPKVLQC